MDQFPKAPLVVAGLPELRSVFFHAESEGGADVSRQEFLGPVHARGAESRSQASAEVFERLRIEPDDSLLSELVNRVIPEWDRPLNDNELHAEMMADTFVGGSETSTNAIAYGVKLRNSIICIYFTTLRVF